ncbi:hypothetical protein BGZ75_007290 [Mortierella antarctica]|nr:hypothetical protein BGZ75_007290 [Mortierella antarctica]
MEQLLPVLMNYMEEHCRPLVQEKVSEELDETKGDLKQDLPHTIMDYITGDEANPMVAKIVTAMGDDFLERIKSVTEATIEMASDGMDLLLTDGVMGIAKKVITKTTEDDDENGGGGGFNMDFLQSGKEGMVNTTMAASAPMIKQASDNMGTKISAHFPAAVGGAVQEFIDEHGGDNGFLGTAAGFIGKFMGGEDGPGEATVQGGGTDKDIEETGGHKGKIQVMLQKILAPKVLLMIQPYLQRFEEKMTRTLDSELRNKIFSIDYIKAKVLSMLTGGDGEGGGGGTLGVMLGALMGGGGRGKGGDDGDGDGDGGSDPMALLGGLASKFLKGRED